jgi:hypothetical protein
MEGTLNNLILEWGPIILYDDTTFRNYLMFQSGVSNSNHFSHFYDNLINNNINDYNSIPPSANKRKTSFLLSLASQLSNFAVTHQLKIVTWVGPAENWFDITHNLTKIKSKVVNKIGKKNKELLQASILSTPITSTYTDLSNVIPTTATNSTPAPPNVSATTLPNTNVHRMNSKNPVPKCKRIKTLGSNPFVPLVTADAPPLTSSPSRVVHPSTDITSLPPGTSAIINHNNVIVSDNRQSIPLDDPSTE